MAKEEQNAKMNKKKKTLNLLIHIKICGRLSWTLSRGKTTLIHVRHSQVCSISWWTYEPTSRLPSSRWGKSHTRSSACRAG